MRKSLLLPGCICLILMPACFVGAFMQIADKPDPQVTAQERERDAKSKVATLICLVVAGFAFGGGGIILFARATRVDRSSAEA